MLESFLNKEMLRVLWAKKSKDGFTWLPLCQHMTDSAHVAGLLWDTWVSQLVRERIASDVSGSIDAKKLFVFLACVHDVGKACPAFQCRRGYTTPELDQVFVDNLKEAGFLVKGLCDNIKEAHHSLVSFSILKRQGIPESVSIVVGGHHGTPPTREQIKSLESSYKYAAGFEDKQWLSAQDDLYRYAIAISDIEESHLKGLKLTRSVQVLLSGLVIMTDWLASDEKLFSLFPLDTHTGSQDRAEVAFKYLALPSFWAIVSNWESLYESRFGITSPHPVQEVLLDAVAKANNPGIFVVEAPMGGGKTEAALVAAEVLADKVGCRGVYFALPTQATSNAMFERVIDWLKTFEIAETDSYSVRLAHGRAEFNDTYADLKIQNSREAVDEDDVTKFLVHEWFTGRKKGLLSDFTVGTVDHVLQVSLKAKHLALRHLGLAGKVVIIDECHAYDVYMESYLLRALNWLGSHGVPVIVLSATLPSSRRQSVIEAYLNKRDDTESVCLPSLGYPQITYTDSGEVLTVCPKIHTSSVSVSIKHVKKDFLVAKLEEVLSDGGYAGVIVNTVKKAQELYKKLVVKFGADSVTLLHSGFIHTDRSDLEKDLVADLGKSNMHRSGRRIVVGTQVFEQSMDIDFDVLFTDLCPMDLLLQRIGRLHRHLRLYRPISVSEPVCYVVDAVWGDFDLGSAYIYGDYLLARTLAKLPNSIVIPSDVPKLVEAVYSDCGVQIPVECAEWYANSEVKAKKKLLGMRDAANTFQIDVPISPSTVYGLIARKADESQLDVTVRGHIDSVEVVIVQQKKGGYCLLPWVNGGQSLPVSELDEATAKTLASCTVRLPYIFSKYEKSVRYHLAKLSEDLGLERAWGKSVWLKDTLFLILDADLNAELCGFKLNYEQTVGLSYTEV